MTAAGDAADGPVHRVDAGEEDRRERLRVACAVMGHRARVDAQVAVAPVEGQHTRLAGVVACEAQHLALDVDCDV